VSDQQHPQSIGYVSNRLLQAMRSGIFVLQQRIPEMERYLGMQDGVHLVIWDTIQEIPEKVNYYLNHEDERRRIAEAGKSLVLSEHTFDKRVEEFDELISGFLSKNRS
jgi:spore maturation protein CgeB